MLTIREKLADKDNDYSHIENELAIKGINFTERLESELKSLLSVSVIIPAYNLYDRLQLTLNSLSIQEGFSHDSLEVLVIDDYSDILLYNNIQVPANLVVKFFRNKNNFGSGICRDIGLYHSTGDISLFLDSDMVPSKYFLREHVIRHQFFDNLLLLGFKENVELRDFANWNVREPDPKKDPRFYKETAKYGIANKKISLYLDTNRFKEFGNGKIMYEDSLPNGWSLPEAIITHSLSIRRDNAITLGGFDSDFNKWGYEDSYFGAKCLAYRLFAVPLLSCASYHIRHPRRREEDKERVRGGNRDIYLSKIAKPLRIFTAGDFENEFYYYIKNSVEING